MSTSEIQNDLLLRTIRGEAVERPPVWLMRQAGRILPQYRAVRSKLSGFVELVKTPQLAAEVTIQPVDELDVDAAIIFSDILVIPEAMGLHYELIEKKGPWFPKTIESPSDIDRLEAGENAAQQLGYVYDAVSATKKALAGRVPLIGFCGAPWTLLTYMVEGQGSKTFSKARRFLYREPKAAHTLLQKLTDSCIAYLKLKIQAGVNVVQIFDSWAGILTAQQYRTFAIPYIAQIASAITEVPVICFSKGAWFAIDELAGLDCEAIGLDWNMNPKHVRNSIGWDKVLQGNFDPCALYAEPDLIESKALKMIQSFERQHIVNLGHGVYPDTPLEHVRHFVNTVKAYRYEQPKVSS
ncbi:MAG: uroporphyrinogen decarboxylase [Bacteroidota bacterium]